MLKQKPYNKLLERIISTSNTSQQVLVLNLSKDNAAISCIHDRPNVVVVSCESIFSMYPTSKFDPFQASGHPAFSLNDQLPQGEGKYSTVFILKGENDWYLNSFMWMKVFSLVNISGTIELITHCLNKEIRKEVSVIQSLWNNAIKYQRFWKLPFIDLWIPATRIVPEKSIFSFLKQWNRVSILKTKTQDEIINETLFPYSQQRKKEVEIKYQSLFTERHKWLSEHQEFVFDSARPFKPDSFKNTKIIVLSPHPDDEIVGCGGTLLQLLKVNAIVTVIQLTDGSATCALDDFPDPFKQQVRIREEKKVAEKMHIHNLQCWRISDQSLTCSQDIIARLSEILLDVDPDIVFVPFINDPHEDHKITSVILQEALQKTAKEWETLKIFCYEVWALVPANVYSNIDPYMEQKNRLLLMYETAMLSVNYVERCAQFHAYNAFLYTRKDGFAESFLELDAETYCQLICAEKKKKP